MDTDALQALRARLMQRYSDTTEEERSLTAQLATVRERVIALRAQVQLLDEMIGVALQADREQEQEP
jgi:cell division protein FtsB